MFNSLKTLHVLCVLLFISAYSQRDLSRLEYDDSDPKSRIPFPVGVAQDVYLHYDLDPTLLNRANKNEQEMVEYLMTLTDIMNRETFNAVNFNLVTSSFSINSKDTDRYVMQEFRDQQVLHEGEAHIWLHVTDYLASSIAGRFGLYDGADRSYAIAAVFNGDGYTHNERTNAAHEIGHLFGLDHTHVLSLSYNDVAVNPDQCGGGPNGADCSTKPTIGGSLMSYCQECPKLQNGGGFYSAKPLTSLHPYQAEKIQEHYDQYKQNLPDISRQKLRTFIPEEAKSNMCAREGQTCFCNGVVYFGPTISSRNPTIFGVEHISGSVLCSSGADETFADVFHGKSKSCYCHQGADLHDITYTPTDVEFTNGGTGECVIQGCGSTKRCSWQEYNGPEDIGHFTISGQPEWKCKQECLDRTSCSAYNFKNGNCRLFQYQPTTTLNSGIFSGSTCWKRSVLNDARLPQPAYQIRDIIIPGEKTTYPPTVIEDDQYTLLDNGEVCPSKASLIDNEDDCLHAVSELDLEQRRQPWTGFIRKGQRKPAGCSYDFNKGRTHFNTNLQSENGVGRGKQNLSPICKVIKDEAVWSAWGPWSTCSLNCGGGIQTQYRTCISGPCVGANSRTQTCNNHACSGSAICEFVAIPSRECPSTSLPDCVSFNAASLTPGTLCRANLAQNGISVAINNCGDSDVLRYTCTDSEPITTARPINPIGRSYVDLGFGICKSAEGYSVRGLAHGNVTPEKCKGTCDERSDCVGYSTTTRSRGTCYVHGPYTTANKPDDTWSTGSGGDYEIVKTNNLESMRCFKVEN